MNATFGVLAHVDAGKTSLCEAILNTVGVLRTAGRVDDGTTLLDHDPIEIRRGITVFSDQTTFSYGGMDFTLIDTPGHADFAAEMLRSLSVLDAAVLVVSAVDGIRGQTVAIWNHLRSLHIPTAIFVNKTDLAHSDADRVFLSLKALFSDDILDFSDGISVESLAERDEALLDAYLDGTANKTMLSAAARSLFQSCQIFPCFRGSALQGTGIDTFLSAFAPLCEGLPYNTHSAPSGIVYQVRNDKRNGRVHHIKLFSGTLSVKDDIDGIKINRILRPVGGKYEPIQSLSAGELGAVTLSEPMTAGTAFGGHQSACVDVTPTLRSRVLFPDKVGITAMTEILRELEAEEPSLHIKREQDALHVSVMGYIQLEVLKELIAQRYGVDISFDKCVVLYRETIRNEVKGYGHFEPLRHYAEVHVRLTPNDGKGIVFQNEVHTDVLAQSFINLVRTHVLEKEHVGILTGSPLTDVTITFTAGKAHLKHTEGGDFREATYRAIRQGLEKAESVILEPYYRFAITIQPELVGKILTDITTFGGTFDDPETDGTMTTVTGTAPVAGIMDYPLTIASTSKGLGAVSLTFDGYRPCHDPDKVIAQIGYDKTRDTENPSGSVFCAKGAGFYVPWDEVESYKHLEG